jgi:hypothetical protein
VVILVVDENSVLALERKGQPPVPAHPHGPVLSRSPLSGCRACPDAFMSAGQLAASRAEAAEVEAGAEAVGVTGAGAEATAGVVPST